MTVATMMTPSGLALAPALQVEQAERASEQLVGWVEVARLLVHDRKRGTLCGLSRVCRPS